ncbi:MAG: hypothetical protein IPJ14_06110 [Kineosporiaceae bacterium]|nr:hypothetical protein [Kineosporiaceae bacterium]MBK7622236.1 hypothetical protein [Kineosporiaceae bacterium]MBK8074564.1 hypothetical protein [Kineosporiaceae bacterium]
MDSADEPTVALLVVRAWREVPEGTDDGLRARIWSSIQLPEQPLQMTVVASADALDEAVSQWIDQVRHG